jgi:hypothetical protein
MTLATEEAWPAQGHFGFEEEQPRRHKKWGCKKQRVYFGPSIKKYLTFKMFPKVHLIFA